MKTMVKTDTDLSGLRLLVAIASYGNRNLKFLKEIIQTYRAVDMHTDIVVFSDSPKALGADVRVIVGLPSKNPWTLPFAHKAELAKNINNYDLFIYSEDDVHVQEDNIRAFVRVSAVLEADEIAGYLRYETGQAGECQLTDMHGGFHWDPESVRRRDDVTIAEFTNDHAGFYILKQSQLRDAIASGGFLHAAYEGRYGLPETAATDPYTCCGFRKVICISQIEGFLIRHMSNLYIGRCGVSIESVREQIKTLMDIANNVHPANALCSLESRMLHRRWSKRYDEEAHEDVLGQVPRTAKRILSIGCGWGATELKLKERGATITAAPLDSVIGAVAAQNGIDVVYGTLDECLDELCGREFDCVVISNLLHLQPDPDWFLGKCMRFVRPGGTLVVNGPNFRRIPTLVKRVFGVGDSQKLNCFSDGGISICGPTSLTQCLEEGGLGAIAVRWINHSVFRIGGVEMNGELGSLTARDWILRAQRPV